MAANDFPSLEKPTAVKTLLTLYDAYCSEKSFSDAKLALELINGPVNSLTFLRMVGHKKTIEALLKLINKDPEAKQQLAQAFNLRLNGQELTLDHLGFILLGPLSKYELEPALERCRALTIQSPYSQKAVRDALRIAYHYRDKLEFVLTKYLAEEPALRYLEAPEATIVDLIDRLSPADKRTLARKFLGEDRELTINDLPIILPDAASHADLNQRLAQLNMRWRDELVGQCVDYAQRSTPFNQAAFGRTPVGLYALQYGQFRDRLFTVFEHELPAEGREAYFSTLSQIFGRHAECGLIVPALPFLEINVGAELYHGTKEDNFALAVSRAVKDPAKRKRLLDAIQNHPDQLNSLLAEELISSTPPPPNEPQFTTPLEEACFISDEPGSSPEQLNEAVKLVDREFTQRQTLPQTVQGLLCRGQSYERLGRSAEALADYNAAIEKMALDRVARDYALVNFSNLPAEAFSHRSRFYLANNQAQEALADLAKTLEYLTGDDEAPLFFLKKWLADWLAADPAIKVKPDPTEEDGLTRGLRAFKLNLASINPDSTSGLVIAEVVFHTDNKERLPLAVLLISLGLEVPASNRFLVLRELVRLAEIFQAASLETLARLTRLFKGGLWPNDESALRFQSELTLKDGIRKELRLWLDQVKETAEAEKERLIRAAAGDLTPQETEALAVIFLSYKSPNMIPPLTEAILLAIKQAARELAGQPHKKLRKFGDELARQIGTISILTDLAKLNRLVKETRRKIEQPED